MFQAVSRLTACLADVSLPFFSFIAYCVAACHNSFAAAFGTYCLRGKPRFALTLATSLLSQYLCYIRHLLLQLSCIHFCSRTCCVAAVGMVALRALMSPLSLLQGEQRGIRSGTQSAWLVSPAASRSSEFVTKSALRSRATLWALAMARILRL